MDTTMNQGVFLSIPKSDIKFFKELAKKMGWDIDIREDFLKDYIASRPKRVNLSEEENQDPQAINDCHLQTEERAE